MAVAAKLYLLASVAMFAVLAMVGDSGGVRLFATGDPRRRRLFPEVRVLQLRGHACGCRRGAHRVDAARDVRAGAARRLAGRAGETPVESPLSRAPRVHAPRVRRRVRRQGASRPPWARLDRQPSPRGWSRSRGCTSSAIPTRRCAAPTASAAVWPSGTPPSSPSGPGRRCWPVPWPSSRSLCSAATGSDCSVSEDGVAARSGARCIVERSGRAFGRCRSS